MAPSLRGWPGRAAQLAALASFAGQALSLARGRRPVMALGPGLNYQIAAKRRLYSGLIIEINIGCGSARVSAEMSFSAAVRFVQRSFDRGRGSRRHRNVVPSGRCDPSSLRLQARTQQQCLSAMVKANPPVFLFRNRREPVLPSRPANGGRHDPAERAVDQHAAYAEARAVSRPFAGGSHGSAGPAIKDPIGSPQPRNRHARAEVRRSFRDDRWNLDPLSHPPRRSAADPEHRPAR